MKTLSRILFVACTLTLAACDEPVDLDAPEALELTPEQLDELSASLEAHDAELAEDPATPTPLLDLDMSEAEPSNEFLCDSEQIATYCMTTSTGQPYEGQCIGQNTLVQGYCILVGQQFGACEFVGYSCNQV